MLCMAPYSREHIGVRLGMLFQKVCRRCDLLQKEAANGIDKGLFSSMLHGQRGLDLNLLFERCDSHLLAQFFGAVLAAKVEDERSAEKKERVA